MRHAIQWWIFLSVVSIGLGLRSARSATAAELVIVQDGQPRATIVVAKDAAGPAKQKTKTDYRNKESIKVCIRKNETYSLKCTCYSIKPIICDVLIFIGGRSSAGCDKKHPQQDKQYH